jgi:hypothetical protein
MDLSAGKTRRGPQPLLQPERLHTEPSMCAKPETTAAAVLYVLSCLILGSGRL